MKAQTTIRHTLPSAFYLCFTLIASLLFTGLAQAAPLTEDQVQSFIDSMRDTEKLDEEYPALEDELEADDQDMTRPISSSMGVLDKYPEVRGRLEEIVEEHGFDDIEQWASVGDRVIVSMMAISVEQMPPEQRQMIESMANPDIDPDAHEAVQQGMSEMAKNMRDMLAAADTASREDMEAVRPYIGQLQAMGEE